MYTEFAFENNYTGETTSSKGSIQLVNECSITIRIDGHMIETMVCSPADPYELITGHLLTEGYIDDLNRIERIDMIKEKDDYGLIAEVQLIPGEMPGIERTGISVPVVWTESDLICLSRYAIEHRNVRSTHSCTVMHNGEIICYKEDISRHNVIDRVVADILWQAVDPAECIIYMSSRISLELIKKAVKVGITVFCSKGLPSIQAVECARENGIALLQYTESGGLIEFS